MLKSATITDDSFDNFLQARGFSFREMVGCSEATTHPTLASFNKLKGGRIVF